MGLTWDDDKKGDMHDKRCGENLSTIPGLDTHIMIPRGGREMITYPWFFLQATSSGGGWPMSVWLTPDLKPFVGGTYFPPEDGIYQVGFRTVLLRIADQVYIFAA